jgi:hypothetical protein
MFLDSATWATTTLGYHFLAILPTRRTVFVHYLRLRYQHASIFDRLGRDQIIPGDPRISAEPRSEATAAAGFVGVIVALLPVN